MKMAKVHEPQSSNCDDLFWFIGMLACAASAVGIVATIVAVWINGSSLSDLRGSFYDFRNRNDTAKYELDSLSARVKAVEDAYNKDHPDAKLGSAGGVTITTCGAAFCYLGGSAR
jgi:hypothetical protein